MRMCTTELWDIVSKQWRFITNEAPAEINSKIVHPTTRVIHTNNSNNFMWTVPIYFHS